MCIQIYNALPNVIKILPNNLFRNRLSVWLQDKNYYKMTDFPNKQ